MGRMPAQPRGMAQAQGTDIHAIGADGLSPTVGRGMRERIGRRQSAYIRESDPLRDQDDPVEVPLNGAGAATIIVDPELDGESYRWVTLIIGVVDVVPVEGETTPAVVKVTTFALPVTAPVVGDSGGIPLRVPVTGSTPFPVAVSPAPASGKAKAYIFYE